MTAGTDPLLKPDRESQGVGDVRVGSGSLLQISFGFCDEDERADEVPKGSRRVEIFAVIFFLDFLGEKAPFSVDFHDFLDRQFHVFSGKCIQQAPNRFLRRTPMNFRVTSAPVTQSSIETKTLFFKNNDMVPRSRIRLAQGPRDSQLEWHIKSRFPILDPSHFVDRNPTIGKFVEDARKPSSALIRNFRDYDWFASQAYDGAEECDENFLVFCLVGDVEEDFSRVVNGARRGGGSHCLRGANQFTFP